MRQPWWFAAFLALGACSGSGGSSLGSVAGNTTTPFYNPSNNGGAFQTRRLPEDDQAATSPAGPTRAELETVARSRIAAADRIWNQAVAIESRDPEEAGDLYESIADDYPETPRAAEARYRQGMAYYRAGEYVDSFRALQTFMQVAPVNQHLAEVEETIYRDGVMHLRTNRGLAAIFTSDEPGLEALETVPTLFPAGSYADDALLALAEYYREDEDYVNAALRYREILLRYPDSEWSFKTRVALGDVYMQMDQGGAYNAGFVDRDPREPLPPVENAMIMAGDVRSAVEAALEQYDLYLERMELDPARAAESAAEVAYVRRRQAEARQRLAAKDLFRGDMYRLSAGAARPYYANAATNFGDTPAGATARTRLAGLPPPPPTPAPSPSAVPPEAPPAGTTPPRGTIPRGPLPPPPAVPPPTAPPPTPPPRVPLPPVPPSTTPPGVGAPGTLPGPPIAGPAASPPPAPPTSLGPSSAVPSGLPAAAPGSLPPPLIRPGPRRAVP